jgi:hypothetical protein
MQISSCHSEPLDCAQDKLREESRFLARGQVDLRFFVVAPWRHSLRMTWKRILRTPQMQGMSQCPTHRHLWRKSS